MVPYNFGETFASTFSTALGGALQRKFAKQEAQLNRVQQLEVQSREHGFQGGQAALNRLWGTSEREATQNWRSGESALERYWRTGERVAGQDYDWKRLIEQHRYGTSEREASQVYAAGEAEKQRGWQGIQNERQWAENRSGAYFDSQGNMVWMDPKNRDMTGYQQYNNMGLTMFGLQQGGAQPPRPEDVTWQEQMARGPGPLGAAFRAYNYLSGDTPADRRRRYNEQFRLYKEEDALGFGGRVRRHLLGGTGGNQPYDPMEGIR